MSLGRVLLASVLGGSPLLEAPLAPLRDVPSLRGADELVLEALGRDTRRLLAAHGIDGLVTWRVKSDASLLAKAARKGLAPDAIADRLALRVRVATEADCYRVRDLVEARHAPIPEERDDYVAHPKPNGYRSLHTAVRTGSGEVVEFQVRTHAMHAEAELGDAAHGRYKALLAAVG